MRSIDILADMIAFFEHAIERAQRAGIRSTGIVLDPGIGFGKTLAQNLFALGSSAALIRHFRLPVLMGASRKSFIDKIFPSPVTQRLAGTLAAHLLAVRQGAQILRVHDVASHRQALAVEQAILGAV